MLNLKEELKKIVLEATRSSRPILWETYSEEFPYFSQGSAFVCRYKMRLFAVTALHVTAGIEPDMLRIPFVVVNETKREQAFVSHLSFSKPVPVGEGGSWADLAIAELDLALNPLSLFQSEPPFELKPETCWYPNLAPGLLIARGFPSERRGIDYERGKVWHHPLILSGKLIGASPEHFCFLMSYGDEITENLNHFSGSPVYYIGGLEVKFAGIVLRVDHLRRQVEFVEARVVRQMLDTSLTIAGS